MAARSKTAPEPASHRWPVHRVANNSNSSQRSRSTISRCRSPSDAAAGAPALDEVGLRLRGVGNRIAALRAKAVVALVAVVDERHGHARLAAADADVRNAVRRRAEVGMRGPRAADEVDERIRLRIERRAGDLLVPPVVRRKQAPAGKIVIELDERRSGNGGRGRGAAPASTPAAAWKWLDWWVFPARRRTATRRDEQQSARRR